MSDDWKYDTDELNTDQPDSGALHKIATGLQYAIAIVLILSPFLPLVGYLVDFLSFQETVLVYLVYVSVLAFLTHQSLVSSTIEQ